MVDPNMLYHRCGVDEGGVSDLSVIEEHLGLFSFKNMERGRLDFQLFLGAFAPPSTQVE